MLVLRGGTRLSGVALRLAAALLGAFGERLSAVYVADPQAEVHGYNALVVLREVREGD